jgi:hypothetical protein
MLVVAASRGRRFMTGTSYKDPPHSVFKQVENFTQMTLSKWHIEDLGIPTGEPVPHAARFCITHNLQKEFKSYLCQVECTLHFIRGIVPSSYFPSLPVDLGGHLYNAMYAAPNVSILHYNYEFLADWLSKAVCNICLLDGLETLEEGMFDCNCTSEELVQFLKGHTLRRLSPAKVTWTYIGHPCNKKMLTTHGLQSVEDWITQTGHAGPFPNLKGIIAPSQELLNVFPPKIPEDHPRKMVYLPGLETPFYFDYWAGEKLLCFNSTTQAFQSQQGDKEELTAMLCPEATVNTTAEHRVVEPFVKSSLDSLFVLQPA